MLLERPLGERLSFSAFELAEWIESNVSDWASLRRLPVDLIVDQIAAEIQICAPGQLACLSDFDRRALAEAIWFDVVLTYIRKGRTVTAL